MFCYFGLIVSVIQDILKFGSSPAATFIQVWQKQSFLTMSFTVFGVSSHYFTEMTQSSDWLIGIVGFLKYYLLWKSDKQSPCYHGAMVFFSKSVLMMSSVSVNLLLSVKDFQGSRKVSKLVI